MKRALIVAVALSLSACTQWKRFTGAEQSEAKPPAYPVEFIGTVGGVFQSTVETMKGTTAWLWDYDRQHAWIDIAEPEFDDLGVIHFIGSASFDTITVSSVTVGACPGRYTWTGRRDSHGIIQMTLDGDDVCHGHVTGHFEATQP